MAHYILTRDLSEVLGETLNLVIELAKADFGNIQVVDTNNHLRIFVHHGFPDWWIDYWNRVTAGQGACGTAIALGERVIVEDVKQSPIFVGTPALEKQLKAGIRAVQSTPVLNQSGQVIAMLSTHYRAPHRPCAKTLKMLDTFSVLLAPFIEQAQTELSLEPQNPFRTVVEDQTEVISRFLPDGTFTFVNEVFCKLFGKTSQQVIGQRWQPIPHPDDVALIETKLREMTPDNPVVTIENRVHAANGEIRWFQFVNRGFFNDIGTLVETQSVDRDITKLKQAESSLRQSEETLQLAESVAKIGYFALNNDSENFSISNETARLFDLDDTGVTTFAQWFSRVHTEDQSKVETAWRAALQGAATYDMTYRIVVQGQIRWIRALAELQFDNHGQLIKAVGTVQDISDLKQIESYLRESESRFRMMADDVPVLIWMSEADKLCSYFNKGWLDFTGRSIEQELGNGWLEGVHPDDIQQCLSTYLQAFDARQTFVMEYRLRNYQGDYRWITDKGKPRVDAEGRFLGYIGSCVDITERHITEDQNKRFAFNDPLTQLANRRLLADHLELSVADAKRNRHYGALVYMDLDNFKPLNDLYGHAAGDLLLIETAKRLNQCVRETDTVARLGGDEFVVLLSKLNTNQAEAIAEALHIAV